MKQLWKKHRIALTAAGLVVCLTACLGTGIAYSRARAEKDVVKAAEKETERGSGEQDAPKMNVPWEEGTLYKDVLNDIYADIGQEVCRKFGLDYETVTMKDVTAEMRNYEEVLILLNDMGGNPLLAENEDKKAIEDDNGYSLTTMSLEIYVDEVYACGGGRNVIEEICSKYDIDPETAVVSDLTAEQLEEIGALAYETSDHPKD